MISSGTRRHIRVVGAAFFDGHDKVLIVRRPPGDTGAGFWEFPGGKIEVGESPEQALHREIQEELDVRARIVGDLGTVFHAYDTTDVELQVFVCSDVVGEIRLLEHDAMQWVAVDELDASSLLEADRPFVLKLRDWLRGRVG